MAVLDSTIKVARDGLTTFMTTNVGSIDEETKAALQEIITALGAAPSNPAILSNLNRIILANLLFVATYQQYSEAHQAMLLAAETLLGLDTTSTALNERMGEIALDLFEKMGSKVFLEALFAAAQKTLAKLNLAGLRNFEGLPKSTSELELAGQLEAIFNDFALEAQNTAGDYAKDGTNYFVKIAHDIKVALHSRELAALFSTPSSPVRGRANSFVGSPPPSPSAKATKGPFDDGKTCAEITAELEATGRALEKLLHGPR